MKKQSKKLILKAEFMSSDESVGQNTDGGVSSGSDREDTLV